MRSSDSGDSGVAGLSDLGAIGFALAGFTFWVLTDTSIKLVGQSGLPAYEMVAFLGLFMAMFLTIYCLARGQLYTLRPNRLSRQVARACLDMGNNVCVVIALRHLTLTLFYILVFTAPMVIALLSAIFLREGLPWRKAMAIFAGFAGVVIAVHPWGGGRERGLDWGCGVRSVRGLLLGEYGLVAGADADGASGESGVLFRHGDGGDRICADAVGQAGAWSRSLDLAAAGGDVCGWDCFARWGRFAFTLR